MSGPDFRGAFLRGYGTNGSYSTYVGNSFGSAQTNTLASHSHTSRRVGNSSAHHFLSPNYDGFSK